jgi:hypothetical protein
MKPLNTKEVLYVGIILSLRYFCLFFVSTTSNLNGSSADTCVAEKGIESRKLEFVGLTAPEEEIFKAKKIVLLLTNSSTDI